MFNCVIVCYFLLTKSLNNTKSTYLPKKMAKDPNLKGGKPIGVRLPKSIEDALKKRVKDKRKDFPRYGTQDVIKIAVINHLKSKGYLDKKKDYL